jgi:type IV pilus assembly protein PilN
VCPGGSDKEPFVNLQINLATRVYIDSNKVNLTIILCLLLTVCWCSFGMYTLMTNRGELQKFAQYKLKSQSQTTGKVNDADYNRLLTEIKTANSILDKRGYDWLTMLDNLELVVPDGVSLKSISPAGKSDLVKLSATARNFSAVRKFIENLESSTKFTDVFLTEQAFVKEGTNSKVISFSVSCRALI